MNDVDACPADGELVNGFRDHDGCPEFDRDRDSVYDELDRCPDTPAKTPDGCPPGDRDGDGIPDEADQCPELPSERADGCPLPDTDGDGWIDDVDGCVVDPETRNGFEDADGCPDEIPVELARILGSHQDGSWFETRTARLTGAGRALAARVAAVLERYPEVRVMIGVHTDHRFGTAQSARERSGRQAEAFRRRLVETHGIDQGRLGARGAGMDEPLCCQGPQCANLSNRRLEIDLVTD